MAEHEVEVPQPIICSPFDEPAEHWRIEEGVEPRRLTGRRPAQYFYRAPAPTPAPKERRSASASSCRS